MRHATSLGILLGSLLCFGGAAALRAGRAGSPAGWDRVRAAQYLDARAAWWQAWPKAQRDEDSACISCHTMLPYALARPLLRGSLNEQTTPAAETRMIADARRRVEKWATVQPYYSDEKFGAGKTVESRATEAVLNALVLVSEEAPEAKSATTIRALDIALDLQLRDGKDRGGWIWQNFHLAPWEGDESPFVGACYMALALGRAPKDYLGQPHVRQAVRDMRDYLARRAVSEPLFNRLHLLWAAHELPALAPSPGLVERTQRDLLALQREGGGWRLADFHDWHRRDGSEAASTDDGYATALALLALDTRTGGETIKARQRARLWLASHQTDTGAWTATSLNKARAPGSDAALFMDDAATAHAVIALLDTTRD